MNLDTTIALIPARGGSKSIPLKNLAKVGNRSLIEIAISNAVSAGIQDIFVSTDSKEIAEVSTLNGAKIIYRSTNISSDTSPTELAVLDAINKIVINDETKILLIQATSPFTKSEDMKLALQNLKKGNSFFSAVEFHGFLWEFKDSFWITINHDKKNRLMKEQMHKTALETGNFYCFYASDFLEDMTRFCKISHPFFIDPITNFQIDSYNDLNLANKILEKLI